MRAWPLWRQLAAVIAPLLVVVVALMAQQWTDREAQVHREALLTARFLMAGIDRELASVQTTLQVLAGSETLAREDLPRLHRTAQATVKTLIANNIVLSDADGRQLMNSLKPWGSVLPAVGNPPELPNVFETRVPVVSDLFMGPVTGTPLVATGVPVFRGDAVVYSLGAGMSPDRIGQVLNRLDLPESWIAAVIDGSGSFIARTHDAPRFVGTKAVPDLTARLAEQREGTLRTRTIDGVPVIAAFSHSQMSRWSVAVGVPTAELQGERRRTTAWVSSALLLSIALAALLLPRSARA